MHVFQHLSFNIPYITCVLLFTESSGCSSLPWILFGMACVAISCLIGVIIALYVKYIRRRKPYIKTTKQGVENPVGTHPNQETSMSSSLPVDNGVYLTTTGNRDCSDHPCQHIVTQVRKHPQQSINVLSSTRPPSVISHMLQ